jgi:amino-acid N-acetyltransferase
MRIVRASAGDWPGVRDLLTESGLPLDGAVEAFETGVVAIDGDRTVGCAAIEAYGSSALLRSVAVASDRRGSGVGSGVVKVAEDLARDGGATDLILLTETAAGWFERLGYATIERSAVPDRVARSIEFATACSVNAVAMRRTLA